MIWITPASMPLKQNDLDSLDEMAARVQMSREFALSYFAAIALEMYMAGKLQLPTPAIEVSQHTNPELEGSVLS